MKLAELHWPEVKDLDKQGVLVVIPVGSLEQHGPHLPFQVDAFIATRLAEDLEKRLPGILMVPPLWVGVSAHHMDFPGSITLRPRVFIDVLRDICVSLYRHGFRRFMLLNGHGGNRSGLDVLAQELYSDPGLSVATLAYWDLVPELVKSMKKSRSKGMGHSGELETSLMLHLAPELVCRDKIPQGILGIEENDKMKSGGQENLKRYVNMKEHSEVGVIGMPSAGNGDIGRQFYRSVLEALEKAARALQNATF